MKDLIPMRNAAQMSSQEIADLVESRHDSVKRTIERLAERGVIALPPLVEKPTGGRPSGEYIFSGEKGKRDSIIAVAQLSPEFTARMVDRWASLEEQFSQKGIPQNYPEALRVAADLAEQNQALAIENQQQAGKIACMENLFKPGMSVTQFCKGLNGVNVMLVSTCLEGRNWLYNESKAGSRWRVTSYARDRYMTEEQIEITPHGAEPFIQHKPVMLKKGAARLYALYLAGELPMKKSWDGEFTHDKALRGAA